MSRQKAVGSRDVTALSAIKRFVGGGACYHEFPRMSLLGDSVNKGKKRKDRGPDPQPFFSARCGTISPFLYLQDSVGVPPPGGPHRGTEADGSEQDGDCSWVHACCWARTASRSGLVAMVAGGVVRGQVQAERRMKARSSSSSP